MTISCHLRGISQRFCHDKQRINRRSAQEDTKYENRNRTDRADEINIGTYQEMEQNWQEYERLTGNERPIDCNYGEVE